MGAPGMTVFRGDTSRLKNIVPIADRFTAEFHEQERKSLLEDQVKEIIWSTFTWADGDYAFAPDKPLKSDVVKIQVFPGC